MDWFLVSLLGFIALRVPYTEGQNVTSATPRRSGHRDSNVMATLQQMQQQLGAMEAEGQRQTSRIQELTRTTTRLEMQRQELMATLDRSEARLSQRLDDIKGDVRKVITLQEVMREDVDKVQQNQLLNKVWLEDQLRHYVIRNSHDRVEVPTDPALVALGNTDILANLQIVQTALYSLRRMADTLQSSINTVRSNLTDLTNLTRIFFDYEKETSVSKSYLQSSLQTLIVEKEDRPQYIGCVNQVQNEEPGEKLPKDCKEVQDYVKNTTGIYRIKPNYANRPMFVYCDMETDNGGWTVIQRRKDGSVDFLREWSDYKHGFGNVGGEFWLGNENLYLITHQGLYELRVDLYDFEDGHAFTTYGGFAVGSEKEKYMLKLLGPLTAGDAGDGMTYHASLPFSTIDVDNDRWAGGSCAKDHTGGWWYNQCDASNLNGQYLNGLTSQEYQGVYWHEWQGPSYSLLATQMMIRPMKHIYAEVINTANVTETTKTTQPEIETTTTIEDTF